MTTWHAADAASERRTDLCRIAAWLDVCHPETAPHTVLLGLQYSRKSDRHFANLQVWGPSDRMEAKLRAKRARQAMISLGYVEDCIPGADWLSGDIAVSAESMSRHEVLEASTMINAVILERLERVTA